MAGAASQAGDADSSRAPGLTSCLQGSVNVHRGALLLVTQWQCISSFVFYIFVTCSLCRVELVVQFPARGSTQVLLCLFPGMVWLWHFLYSVGPHPVSSLHIYPLLSRGHSWRVRLAKQVTLTPPSTWSPSGLRVWVSLLVFNVTCNDISVIYVTVHRCADGLKKKLDLQSGSQRHRLFVGFFPREDAGGLSREYVLRIPSVS